VLLASRWSPLRPPLCRLRPLRCLQRCPISTLVSPWHCKDPRSCTSFCPWACRWEPFLRWRIYLAVVLGRWLPQQVFIHCIAIGNILPAPLVIFVTFVGFQGGYVHGGLGYAFAGATVITIGMLSPCFILTIIGHHVLETLVRNKVCQCLPTFPCTL